MLSGFAVVGRVWADESLVPAAPLVPANTQPPPSAILLKLTSAQRALEMGFPSIAVQLYQAILDDTTTDATVRNRVVLDMVTALLAEDRTAEAEKVLARYTGPQNSSYHLRAGLLAARARRFDQARPHADAAKPEDLPKSDQSWLFYLRGLLADATRQPSAPFYQQAVDAAVSSHQKAHFLLVQIQAHVAAGEANEAAINALKQRVDTSQGRLQYTAVTAYVLALNALGRRAEATGQLVRQLQVLPPGERGTRDDWQLLLGLIAGASEGPGRIELGNLLSGGADRDKQRVALQMLATASRDKNTRDDLRRRLNDLIGASKPHPILEDLLLFRAQLGLVEKSEEGYRQAEADANRLLTQFPGSLNKALALGVLTSVAWDSAKYRTAAAQAAQARAEFPAGETRARLGVLVAEAYYRAGDFRNAADAYGAALGEVPQGVSAGDLMFQRVLAEIQASHANPAAKDHLKQAEDRLDELANDPRFDPTNRWQAEWNLSRALQADGEIAKAYARVNRLLEGPAVANAPRELKARMSWLQARLAYESGELDRAKALAAALLAQVPEMEKPLGTDIASTTMLLQAEANFASDKPEHPGSSDTALEILAKLRAEYPKTDATAYSYLVQADVYASNNRLVEAQDLLTRLADNPDFRGNAYIPFALYKAALYAEQRAQAAFYHDAYNILQRLLEDYPRSDLVFYALLKQGHLLRLLNDFGSAQQVYEKIIADFPQHGDVRAADLALADCHAEQAATDVAHREKANEIYERLLDSPAAPLDMRVEAGFKFGSGLASSGDESRALQIWGEMINLFLVDDIKAAELGANGRWWMARTLLQLGDLFRQQSKLEQARAAYELLLRRGLLGSSEAAKRLAAIRPTTVQTKE